MGVQKVCEIDGVKIGGEVGVNPVALIGSIFYSHHGIVEDTDKGVFDEKTAEHLINEQVTAADDFGVGSVLDVVAEAPDAMVQYIDFVAEHFDGPLVLDGFVDARMRGLEYAEEVGLLDRIIYNSVSTTNPDKELKLLERVPVKNAIIFSFDPHNSAATARLRLLSGSRDGESLLVRAERLGIENMLIDNVPSDIASLGDVIESNILIKGTYGHPVGCGPANVSYYMGDFLKENVKEDVLVSSVDSLAHLFSDFLFYGPIERAETAFQSAYVVEDVKNNCNILKDLQDLLSR